MSCRDDTRVRRAGGGRRGNRGPVPAAQRSTFLRQPSCRARQRRRLAQDAVPGKSRPGHGRNAGPKGRDRRLLANAKERGKSIPAPWEPSEDLRFARHCKRAWGGRTILRHSRQRQARLSGCLLRRCNVALRIAKITIKNLCSVRDSTIDVGNLAALVGPNGLGKSAILRAMNLFEKGRPARPSASRPLSPIAVAVNIRDRAVVRLACAGRPTPPPASVVHPPRKVYPAAPRLAGAAMARKAGSAVRWLLGAAQPHRALGTAEGRLG